MSNIIDRRLNPRDKTIKNRQKFIKRSQEQIKKAVKESIDKGNIADIENGKIRVKVKNISEPEFGVDHNSGNKKYILPGNKTHVVGDTQEKPEESGGGGGRSGGRGESEDDFEFVLDHKEYLDFIFDDLELPDLVKKQIKDVTKYQYKRAGYTNTGNPSQLDIVRSLKNSLGRRIGLNRPRDEELEEIEHQLELAREQEDKQLIVELEERLSALKNRQLSIPWLDPFDVRYRNFTQQAVPSTRAVMFCIMDVSASMGQKEKDMAKRFFFLLHMFLMRKYERVEIVFIRHHEIAIEVDEEEFFHSRESGGTIVSSALELTQKIIKQRYNVNDWNIYVAQASDGDNHSDDADNVYDIMNSLLKQIQYFAYVEVRSTFYLYSSSGVSELWESYELISSESSKLNMCKVTNISDIWTVFKDLFTVYSGK